jgi:NadR type nicotinamide-nucleotide adenylyltransferase
MAGKRCCERLMSRFRLGLVVGKFAPLHLGHVALVEHAAAHCDRVLVLSYSRPEFADCGPERRRRWLQETFPFAEVEVLEAREVPPNDADDATHQRFLAHLLDTRLAGRLGRRPDALFASEPYAAPCAAVMAEVFGHTVAPVMFDAERRRVPISATRLRADPPAGLCWMPPAVRADFVPRVALLGGESSGKSSLALALAAAWGGEAVAEYGREHWEARGGHLEAHDLLAIAVEQCRREDLGARSAFPALACDTSPLTTLGYALWTHGEADPRLAALARRPYALTVLCGDEIPFVQDGTRRDAAFRARQQAWYRQALGERGIPWIDATGSLAERVAQVNAALASGRERRRPE